MCVAYDACRLMSNLITPFSALKALANSNSKLNARKQREMALVALRAGELEARASVPGLPAHISVSSLFWTKITSAQFKSGTRLKEAEGDTGAFLVKAHLLSDELMDFALQQQDELCALIRQIGHFIAKRIDCEIFLERGKWEAFVDRYDLSLKADEPKKLAGRPPKDTWGEAVGVMASLIVRDRTSDAGLRSAEAYAKMTKERVPDAPDEKALASAATKIRAELQKQ